MKKLTVVMLIFLFVFTAGCGNVRQSGKLKVAATIFPIYDFVKNIGGEFVEPILIVRPGESPHTFSPTIRDLKRIKGAKAIFVNNFGLDEWVKKIASSAGIKNIVNVNETLSSVVKAHNGNPHLWLNPDYAIEECRIIRDTLCRIDPPHSKAYEKNFENYTEKIKAESEEIKKELSDLKNKNFVAFHPAYEYFAEYFGLNEIAVVEETPGQKPTPKKIMAIENLIKSGKVKVIFKEPQLSSDVVDAIKEDTGVKVSELDPLGGVSGRESYMALIKYDADVIKRVLGGE